MSSEPESSSQNAADSVERQLCGSCMFPNEPEANFCAKCGAPLSSYAATGPFEHLLAEGHVYRQAAERPRKFIVVLGVWIIFGAIGLTGIMFVGLGGFGFAVFGSLLMAVAIVMIAKTTWNYFAVKKTSSAAAEVEESHCQPFTESSDFGSA